MMPPVAVSGRAGVALVQTKAALGRLRLFVERELQAHAVGIVHAAGEAVILLYLDVAGVVALARRLSGHGIDSIVDGLAQPQRPLTAKDASLAPERSAQES